MASTPVIYSTVYQSGLAANATRQFKDVTTLSDGIFWAWMVELKRNPLYKASVFICLYNTHILSAIGVPCNILSFLVLRRIKPLTSAVFITMLLAVVDTLSLIVPTLYMTIERISATPLSNVGCSILLTMRYFLLYLPIWLVLLLTLERVVAVCFPMKAAQICTIANARRSIVILVILDVLLCIVHTFVYERKQIVGDSVCRIKEQFTSLMDVWVVVDGAFFVIIPLIVLCVSNALIIVKLATSKNTNRVTTGSSVSEESKRQNKSITVMLLAVSITTAMCLGPSLLFILFDGVKWFTDFSVSVSIFARRQLVAWIVMSLTSVNSAVNFFLYVLSGRRFRTELYEMIASWFGKHKVIIAPLTTTNR